MKLPHERSYAIATLLTAAFLATQAVSADEIRIKVPVPPTPKIVLPAPPPMVWLPGPQVYVAHESPHHIFHHSHQYYLFHQDVWYIGPAYNGPWKVVKIKQVPPGLRKYRGEHWGSYQREAARNFREGRDHGHHPFYAGRPHERAHWKGDRHDRDQHRGHDKHEKKEKHGRGRGHDKD